MRSDLPTGTVTFLFTDVEGSTELLRTLGAEAYGDVLAEHRRVVREACAPEGGVEVDTQGDAFFFAFPTAPGALAAAERFTDALASGPIQVRVGLHTGTPLLAEEGYVGDDVHFAARVAASGNGGQVILSRATADLVELELTDLGEHRLKDIAEAVSIFQLGDGSFPPLKTISNTNLPRPASSFVGREAELGEVLSRLESGARLLTLTGPGGTGKTRLAIEAASTLVPEYKAGVFWVGVASLRDPALVTETIAQTLGAKDSLAEHIGERELLLLLDNLEHVIEAAPELPILLQACPNLTLLVTSRELLRVQGEVEYPVPPLAEPEAVSLFCERSRLEPSEEISELCARLDFLPLAVELAAARTKALSVSQIHERLSGHLDLLKGGRDTDPRQQTLRATIEWSYDLLSPGEQQLFARLSVFVGGCTLEAVEEVTDADLDTLQSLVEKSLLRFTNERYWMLETIREFASERLDGASRDNGQRKHARYYLRWAETRVPLTLGPARPLDLHELREFDVEHNNLRHALDWLGQHEPELELRLTVACHYFWIRRGYWREGADRTEAAMERVDDASLELQAVSIRAAGHFAWRRGDFDHTKRLAERGLALRRSAGMTGMDLGHGYDQLAIAEHMLGNHDRAGELYERVASLAQEDGDDRSRATMLNNLGNLALEQGDHDKAQRYIAEGLTLDRRLDRRAGVANALVDLGFLALLDDRLDDASAAFGEAARICLEEELRETLLWALEGVAAVGVRRADVRESVALLAACGRVRMELSAGAYYVIADNARDRALASARAKLGDSVFAEAWAQGMDLAFDEAAALALRESDVDA